MIVSLSGDSVLSSVQCVGWLLLVGQHEGHLACKKTVPFVIFWGLGPDWSDSRKEDQLKKN